MGACTPGVVRISMLLKSIEILGFPDKVEEECMKTLVNLTINFTTEVSLSNICNAILYRTSGTATTGA